MRKKWAPLVLAVLVSIGATSAARDDNAYAFLCLAQSNMGCTSALPVTANSGGAEVMRPLLERRSVERD